MGDGRDDDPTVFFLDFKISFGGRLRLEFLLALVGLGEFLAERSEFGSVCGESAGLEKGDTAPKPTLTLRRSL